MKKGIFFTAASILIVSFLLSSATYTSYTSRAQEAAIVEARVTYADDYVSDLSRVYLPRIIHVSGYRAMYALTEYLKDNAIADEDAFNDLFKELLLKGTISGAEQDLMKGYSLFYKLSEIETKSADVLRIRTSFAKDYDAVDVRASQTGFTGPWQINVNLSINYTVDVVSAFWNRSETINSTFSIEGLHEPLLVSKEKYENAVRQRNNTALNITGFYYGVNSMTYSFNKNAPSFLQRFYNDFTASECCGIETMINPKKISVAAEKSYADWCVYSARCTETLYYVSCITSEFPEFKINAFHGAQYNISDYLYPLDDSGSCSETPWPPDPPK